MMTCVSISKAMWLNFHIPFCWNRSLEFTQHSCTQSIVTQSMFHGTLVLKMSHGQKHQWAYEFCKWEIKLFVCFARLRAVMYIKLNVHCEASGEAKGKIRVGRDSQTYLTPEPFFFSHSWETVFSEKYCLSPKGKVSNTWLSWVNGAESLYFPHPSQTFPDPGLFTSILTFLPFLCMISWTAWDLIFILLF